MQNRRLRQLICEMSKPTSSLAAWYKAENNTNDELGLHNGTAGATTHYTASGHSGSAFEFNGSTRTDCVNLPALGLSTEWSMECWIRPTDVLTDYRHVVSRYWTNSVFGALYLRISGYLDYWLNGASVVSTSGLGVYLAPATWAKVKLTRSADNKHRLYVNDSLAGTQSGTSPAYALNAGIGIGNNYRGDGFGDSDNPFKGYIDDVKFFNKAV